MGQAEMSQTSRVLVPTGLREGSGRLMVITQKPLDNIT